jgi:hypothetical protein
MKIWKQKSLGVFAVLLAALVAWDFIRGTGVGYIESVTGVGIPWPREYEIHGNYDYGQFSFIRLSDNGAKKMLDGNSWRQNDDPERFLNEKLTLDYLQGADPLLNQQNLLWMEGRSKSNKWVFMLEPESKGLWVVVLHPDMAGDKP